MMKTEGRVGERERRDTSTSEETWTVLKAVAWIHGRNPSGKFHHRVEVEGNRRPKGWLMEDSPAHLPCFQVEPNAGSNNCICKSQRDRSAVDA